LIVFADASARVGYVVKRFSINYPLRLAITALNTNTRSMNKVVGVPLAGVALYGLVRLLHMQSFSDLSSLTLVNPYVHNVYMAGM
jgi:hypothetical protein